MRDKDEPHWETAWYTLDTCRQAVASDKGGLYNPENHQVLSRGRKSILTALKDGRHLKFLLLDKSETKISHYKVLFYGTISINLKASLVWSWLLRPLWAAWSIVFWSSTLFLQKPPSAISEHWNESLLIFSVRIREKKNQIDGCFLSLPVWHLPCNSK